jgi:hypothetical protein
MCWKIVPLLENHHFGNENARIVAFCMHFRIQRARPIRVCFYFMVKVSFFLFVRILRHPDNLAKCEISSLLVLMCNYVKNMQVDGDLITGRTH